MLQIERIKSGPINTDVSPRSVDQQGNRLVVNPVLERKNSRYRSSETGEIESEQNIPGTIQKNNSSLPAGTNTTIGTFTDRESGRVIYFNHNSNDDHNVWAWNPTTNAFTLLIQSDLLNFSLDPRYRITGVGISQNLLYWSDGLNPQRMINMTRSYAGITDDVVINMYKRPPVRPPYLNQVVIVTVPSDYYLILTGSIPTSGIAGNIYQFATRNVFLDNEVSALSQYTQPVNSNPNDTLTKFTYNGFQMYVYIQPEIKSILKNVQLLYRKNNSAEWYIYREIKISEFTTDSILVQFYDEKSSSIIPTSEVAKLFDSVPIKSKALTVFKNRSFLSTDLEGYDVAPVGSANITLNVGEYSKSLKEGNALTYGIVYFDKEMRTPGVVSPSNLSVPYITAGPTGIDVTIRRSATIALAGTHPTWARYYAFCRTLNQNYELFMQIPVKPMFYVSEGDLKNAAGSVIAIPSGMEKYNNGKVYLTALPNLGSIKFSKLHLQTPEILPFIPDSECLIRIITPLTGITNKDTVPVQGFDGNSIICDNFPGFNWSASGYNASPILIEVFKIKKGAQKLFYEISQWMAEIPSGGFPPITFATDWDIYNNDPGVGGGTYGGFKNMKITGNAADACYDPATNGNSIRFESPTGINRSIAISDQDRKTNSYDNIVASSSPNSPDFSRTPDSFGRLIAFNPTAKQSERKTTIRFSNPYIQDSNINGLSSYDALNEYALPTYRTPITKLQPAGNVLLAIHERTTTSLYVGEGFVKNADGTDVLTKTDAVIGQERELAGGYGSYHPESIAEWGSIVFGFDIFKGVVWQYDNNGQVPVSDIGMKTEFFNKALEYMPYKDEVSIIGGIDPLHKEYLITFPEVVEESTVVVAKKTYRYNFAAREWVGNIDYYPEAYATINNLLVSFVSGQLWVHNQDRSNYNTFYGTKYPRVLKWAVNPFPSRIKAFMGIQVNGLELTEGDRFPVQNYANQAAFPVTGAAGIQYEDRSVVDPITGVGRRFIWNGSAYVNIWEAVVVNCQNREGQSTYMKRKEFDRDQDIFYGPILKDVNTPSGLLNAGTIALRDGRDMISQVLEVTVTNNSKAESPMNSMAVSYTHVQHSL